MTSRREFLAARDGEEAATTARRIGRAGEPAGAEAEAGAVAARRAAAGSQEGAAGGWLVRRNWVVSWVGVRPGSGAGRALVAASSRRLLEPGQACTE